MTEDSRVTGRLFTKLFLAFVVVLFLGMAGLTIDLGHAYVCHRELQASTDAATLAGAYAMTLPDATSRELLFVRLLELNGKGLANCAFGLVGDRVVVVSERPAKGLDLDETDQIIRHLAAVADTYDDKLVKEFGGTRASDMKLD